MAFCPLCLFENPDGASVCEHCGRFRFPEESLMAPDADALTINNTVLRNEVATRLQPSLGESPQTLQNVPRFGEPVQAVAMREPRLVVVRGQLIGQEFRLLSGVNIIGRSADKPADIDLSRLEAPEQIWSSRQHASITRSETLLVIEDLNSLNGTFVNRAKLQPGRKYDLKADDIIQIGTVQFRVMIQ
jgi:hypothetical protein